MIWLVLGSLVPSMVVAWAAAFWVRRYGPRLGLVDRPGYRKVHQTPTPTSGGVAIWLGIVVPLALGEIVLVALLATSHTDSLGTENGGQARPLYNAAPVANPQSPIPIPAIVKPHVSGLAAQSGKLWEVLAGGTVLVILGLIDDRRGLDWRFRLGAETLVAAMMVALGFRMTLFVDAPLVTGVLSVIWIVGLINSFNMLDNMDGLSAGVAAIAASILAALMLLGPNPKNPVAGGPQLFVGGFLLVVVGSLLGFLWHNRPRARLFMGDAGSYLVGYLLAIATLTGAYAGQGVPRHAILAPLCVLAVPLYDSATVIWIRLRAGRSPFVGDKSHFSHRLVELGMSKTQAVLTIYLATATCGLGAFLLHEVPDEVGAGVILLLVACTLLLVGILETTGRRNRHRSRNAGETPAPRAGETPGSQAGGTRVMQGKDSGHGETQER